MAWQRYPDFSPPGLLVRLAERYGWVPEGVLVGNGSNELIQATLSVTLGPGDVVVAPTPTFSLYRLLTNVLGGRYVPVGLGPEFEYDVNRVIEAAVRERARVVILNSPNNPSGAVMDPRDIESIVRLAHSRGIYVISDECYVYLDYTKPSQSPLTRTTATEMEQHYKAGHFPPGNIGPKVESVLRFLKRGGREAVITSFTHMLDAVAGKAGTHIVPDQKPVDTKHEEHVCQAR